jgi:hypothetical protein
MNLTYQLEPDLTVEDFIDVLVRSTLAERRPVSERHTIGAMLKNADVIVTARLDRLLVGVSRAITATLLTALTCPISPWTCSISGAASDGS